MYILQFETSTFVNLKKSLEHPKLSGLDGLDIKYISLTGTTPGAPTSADNITALGLDMVTMVRGA